MQIGEVIRKYRKERNLTQEEMANCLGVTAPAVNKWENANSLPDILLLAPIARLLGISLNTLLSFREELFCMVGSLVFSFDSLFGRANRLSFGNSNREPTDHDLLCSYLFIPEIVENTTENF
jgi:transcriptional regulator with XRE-family HTH domain